MASWMIHLRVAQELYKQMNLEYAEEFIMGNIAPDSGTSAPDGKGFIPGAEISHFRTLDENGLKRVHENRFIEKYLTAGQRKHYDVPTYTFYLGYLTHLLTDKLWVSKIAYPAVDRFASLYENDRPRFWKKIKRDWYDLDFLYLKNHPGFEAFRIYEGMEDFRNSYMDFFTEDAFDKQRQFITDFYRKGVEKVTEREMHLTPEELDDFVAFAVAEIMRYTSVYRSEMAESSNAFWMKERCI